jgi:hypothetical protein
MARIETNNPATLGVPRWAGDFMGREHLVPGGARLDATQFASLEAVRVTVGGAAAAQGATSVPVTALTGPIPAGTVLYFGSGEFARLTAAAAAGATSLTVEALPNALEAADTALYDAGVLRTVPSGTAIGRTLAERDAATGFGPADAADDEIFLVAFDVTDAVRNPDVELYRHNSIVKENFLPGWAGLASGVKDAIRELYTCTLGAE